MLLTLVDSTIFDVAAYFSSDFLTAVQESIWADVK